MEWGSKKIHLSEKSLPSIKFNFIFKSISRYLDAKKFKQKDKIKLLDFGCGNGKMIYSLYDIFFDDINFYGCDIRTTKPNNFNFIRIKANQKLPYTNEEFDLIICIDVLEHIPNYEFYINEIMRILKKDGSLIIFSPIEGEKISFYTLYKKLFGQNLYVETKDHINPFKRDFFISLFTLNGHTVKEKQYIYHFFGHFFDATFFLFHKFKTVKDLFWNKNLFYKNIDRTTVTEKLFNFFLVLANLIAYYESMLLRKVSFLSAGLLIEVKKK
jgi:2-polyprenyl-3-methyl-5-hydroxy-6-metoxy-1,4-benzoquinol methylase